MSGQVNYQEMDVIFAPVNGTIGMSQDPGAVSEDTKTFFMEVSNDDNHDILAPIIAERVVSEFEKIKSNQDGRMIKISRLYFDYGGEKVAEGVRVTNQVPKDNLHEREAIVFTLPNKKRGVQRGEMVGILPAGRQTVKVDIPKRFTLLSEMDNGTYSAAKIYQAGVDPIAVYNRKV